MGKAWFWLGIFWQRGTWSLADWLTSTTAFCRWIGGFSSFVAQAIRNELQ